MPLKVIGAGLGRTGTHSLKLGLERLLGSPCYHMVEVFEHPEHVPIWVSATKGEPVDWDRVFTGYSAAVDWPSASFYAEIMKAYPDAIVVHSTRDAESWWASAHATIFNSIDAPGARNPEWHAMITGILTERFTSEVTCKDSCIAAFEKFNAGVIATVPPERLVVWHACDGWAPLCAALDLPVPQEPFPCTNTTEQFLARVREGQARSSSQPES
jgi:hypothetical protein